MYTVEALEDDGVLVERHMELVRRIAHHLHGRLPATVQVQDLIQAGAMALMEAARQYDQRHGASFETYAGIRIRGAMLDEARRLRWAPRSAHQGIRKIGAALQAVEARTGRPASASEVAAELGVDLDDYHRMLRKVTQSQVLRIEDVFGPDSDDIVGNADDPAEECLREKLKEAVAAAIAQLPEREQLVLALYYDEELNLREIGEAMGVSESRVCQLHGQALVRLRAQLASGGWEGALD